MSGGKGKSRYSKYATKFKRTCKAFKKFTDDKDEDNRVAKWWELRGIYGVLNNTPYKNSNENMLPVMKRGIMSSDGKNKDNYLNAITCLEKGDTTILSDNGTCTPYADEADDQESSSPLSPTNPELASVAAAPVVAEPSPDVAAADVAAAPSSADAADVAAAPSSADAADVAAAPISADAETADSEGSAADASLTPASPLAPVVDDDANASALNPADEADENIDVGAVSGDTDVGAAPAPAPENIQSGGRSRRHTKSSRRVKSRKSKKGRMTRRKHRSSGRR